MNCAEAQALLGRIIDGVVSSPEKKGFHDHLASCDPCKRSYELEVVAKSLVQSFVRRLSTPGHVRRSIMTSLNHEVRYSIRPWYSRLFGVIPAPAYAGIAVLALLVYIFFSPADTSLDDMIRHAGERDVIEQTTANFALIRDGSVKPSMTTCSPENIYAYLHSQNLPFEALVRPLDQCDGYSAMVNEYDGVRLAHVVYTIGDDILYVYEVHSNEPMLPSGHLTMPAAAKEALRTNGVYTDPEHPDCNIVLWQENGTICAATSTMSKAKMVALLTER